LHAEDQAIGFIDAATCRQNMMYMEKAVSYVGYKNPGVKEVSQNTSRRSKHLSSDQQ
jgi:hypothetical protein